MENLIEKEFKKENFKTEEELGKFIENLKMLIREYEQDLYDKGIFNKQNLLLIKSWKSKLYHLSQKRDTLIVANDIPDVLESTVNILNRQIRKIDSNTVLLNKGTIKLMGLDYTNTDIDKELLQTKNKIIENKNIENKEIRMMYLAFYVFCGTCIIVLLDKFILKL